MAASCNPTPSQYLRGIARRKCAPLTDSCAAEASACLTVVSRNPLQKLALSESPQAEVQALPPVSGVIGFVVGGIVLRSTQSLCRRKLDRT